MRTVSEYLSLTILIENSALGWKNITLNSVKWKRNATPTAFEIGVEIDSETLQVYLENCVFVSVSLQFCRDFGAEVRLRFWILIWSRYWSWKIDQDFKVYFWPRLWGWDLVKILKLNFGQDSEAEVTSKMKLNFGQGFKTEVRSRLWGWRLVEFFRLKFDDYEAEFW